MKPYIQAVLACAIGVALPAFAAEANGCPDGSYAIVLAPDGSTLSVMFDQLTVDSGGTQKKVCQISAPLNLPANKSIGVYKVDYRGFAKLAAKQEADLEVKYFLGPHNNPNGRVFKRKIKGPQEADYFFTENIGAGQMKRVGCGADAVLNVAITLDLPAGRSTTPSMASFDTADGAKAAKGGAMVYHLDLKNCP